MDCVDALYAGVDVRHLDDCWIARIEVPEPTLNGRCRTTHHAFIDKWTCMPRWIGEVEVEIEDEPHGASYQWEKAVKDVSFEMKYPSYESTVLTIEQLRAAGIIDEEGNFHFGESDTL